MMPPIQEIILVVETSVAASLVVKATFVMMLALMVVFLPARKSRASLRHTLLAAAFAVLLVLPVVAIVAPPVPIPISAPQPPRMMPVPLAATEHAPVAPAETVAFTSLRPAPFSITDWLSAAWLLGVMLFLLPVAVGLKQVRSLRRTGIPWPRGQSLTEALARRPVEVLLHEKVSGPTTFGTGHPVILLPLDAENWAADDLNRALVHELEHVRRGDWLSHCLARVVSSVYWFHPLIWIMWRQFALDAERACDDAVLGRAEATAYADQLVGLARRLSALRKSPGLAMASRADLTSRVAAVLDGRQRRGRAGRLPVTLAWIAAAILVAAVAPLMIVAAPQAGTPRPVGLPIAMPAIVLAQAVAPPTPAPPAAVTSLRRFSANSNLVLLDITVKDQNGKPIDGLHANDFVLTEDGKAQTIGLFELFRFFVQEGIQTIDMSYYLLGYYTTDDNPDGGYRQIRVALKNNSEAKLDYRAGYYGSRVAAGANQAVTSDGSGPTLIFHVDPEYSEEARKAKYSGTVVLRIDINTSGQVTHATVTRSLGMGLDEKAIEAVTKWKFRPVPLATQSEVSVNFRLL